MKPTTEEKIATYGMNEYFELSQRFWSDTNAIARLLDYLSLVELDKGRPIS